MHRFLPPGSRKALGTGAPTHRKGQTSGETASQAPSADKGLDKALWEPLISQWKGVGGRGGEGCTTGQRKRWLSCASFEAQMQAIGCLRQIGPTGEPATGEMDGQPVGSPQTAAPNGFPSPESRLL